MKYNKKFKSNQSKNENNNEFYKESDYKDILELGEYIKIPNTLTRFINTTTEEIELDNNKKEYLIHGYINLSKDDCICPECKSKMHYHDSYQIKIKDIPHGNIYSKLDVERKRFVCSKCGLIKAQAIPFQVNNHTITINLKNYIKDLLAKNTFTNKDISYLTGVNRNIVKEIDKERLLDLYTIDGKELIKPENPARYLGIDEFKLHDGYKYATHIIDLETGHILWIAEGKKKQIVYDFIEHVGLDWMKNVVAIACDMNSDFEAAFREKCPHIKTVFDYFHIVKNFNEKVVSEIRKDEQKRLKEEGRNEEAERLRKSRFILTSSIDTLKRKDEEASENKVIRKGSKLFKTDTINRKGNYLSRYETLVNENELILICELIKEMLEEAFKQTDEEKMAEYLFEIMELCEDNGNVHLKWFLKLIYNHFDGIITHATYHISSGKIEGINNKIKTIRRQAYGYPDDEYFFLKLFDASRH